MLPSRGDGLLGTVQAAQALGVKPSLVRKWRQRGHLRVAGLDEHGRPLHTLADLRETEAEVRARGLAVSGIDPRRLRNQCAA